MPYLIVEITQPYQEVNVAWETQDIVGLKLIQYNIIGLATPVPIYFTILGQPVGSNHGNVGSQRYPLLFDQIPNQSIFLGKNALKLVDKKLVKERKANTLDGGKILKFEISSSDANVPVPAFTKITLIFRISTYDWIGHEITTRPGEGRGWM